MSCPRCTGPSESGLCRDCELEDQNEWYQGRAEAMLDADADRSGGDDHGD